MVEGDIQNHGDSAGVTAVHKSFEIVRLTVDIGHREIENGVVAPTGLAWKCLDRHQFNGVDPKIDQIVNSLHHRPEIAKNGAIPYPFAGKVPHIQFIDNHVAQGRRSPLFIRPRK